MFFRQVRRQAFLARLSDHSQPSVPADFSNEVIAFYSGSTDFQGRTLTQILQYSNPKLEEDHSYIQILFPLPERSPFNPSAPVIDEATARAFRQRPELRHNLREAFKRMMAFYGFMVSEQKSNTEKSSAKEGPTTVTQESTSQTNDSVVEGDSTTATKSCNMEQKASIADAMLRVAVDGNQSATQSHWCRPFDHNHLRITRIIRCLRVLGLDSEAQSFYDALLRMTKEIKSSNRIPGQRSRMYWKRAISRPLEVSPEDENYND